MFVRLGRGTILRTYLKLGLQGASSPHLNARLQKQGTNPVQPPNSKQTATPTVPPHQTQLWSQNATHSGRRYIPTPQQGGQEIHSGSMRNIPILWTRRRQHNPPCTQCPRVATVSTHGKHKETHKIVPTWQLRKMQYSLTRPATWSLQSTETHRTYNGAVLNILQIIQAVMSSTAEAELGALFINAKMAVAMRRTLEELGHPQPRTPIQTDNKTANNLLTNRIMPKALKAMDMRFNWLRCRNAQGQFRYCWRPGTQNLADYFTKHHPASHHKSSRPVYLTSSSDSQYKKLIAQSVTASITNSFVKSPLKSKILCITATSA